MSTHQDDLDLLLSLQDRVLETPPASPSTLRSQAPGCISNGDMSVFRDAVQEYLEDVPETIEKVGQVNKVKDSKDVEVEKFSGLRIRNPLVSAAELSNHFSDIRFVRLPAIRNLLAGDTLAGCWATVGVLTEKGNPRTSSTGKTFCIWRISCLDENTIPVFLFGDAYQKNWKEQAGTVFALFNCGVRKDAVASGTYCRYHSSKASQKYSVTRAELKGGNLRTAFRDPLKSEGIYVVDPLTDKTNIRKPTQPMKVLSVDGLKKALSKAGKVTTNIHSQGIRFLTEVTEKMHQKVSYKGSEMQNGKVGSSDKRLLTTKLASNKGLTKKPDAKRKTSDEAHEGKPKQSPGKRTKQASEKMIELEVFSSEEEG